MEHDKELKAMNDIIAALDGLEDGARARVVKYVLERLGIANNQLAPQQNIFPASPQSKASATSPAASHPSPAFIDIRMLKEQKQPKSAIQMAVLVAYYLQEVVSIADRKEAIDTGDIEKYFKQAPYKLPAGKNGSADVLNNAKKAGYFEATGRGTYKLNPVGYNLIAHGLPENSTTSSYGKKKATKKSSSKKTSKKK